MPHLLDCALVALFAAVWPLYTHLVEWPLHLKRVAAGDPGARIALYARTIVQQWALAAAVAALWVWFARPLDGLALGLPAGWRLAVGAGVPALYVALMLAQIPAVAKSAATRARLRLRLAPLTPLLPHRAGEWRWFVPLAVTAGLCEELLFRGYFVWALRPWLGLYGAAGLSMAIFGLAHSYQGKASGLKVFGASVFMGVLALVTRSIVPGMLLHALVDLGSGYVSHLALREPEPEARPATA